MAQLLDIPLSTYVRQCLLQGGDGAFPAGSITPPNVPSLAAGRCTGPHPVRAISLQGGDGAVPLAELRDLNLTGSDKGGRETWRSPRSFAFPYLRVRG